MDPAREALLLHKHLVVGSDLPSCGSASLRAGLSSSNRLICGLSHTGHRCALRTVYWPRDRHCFGVRHQTGSKHR